MVESSASKTLDDIHSEILRLSREVRRLESSLVQSTAGSVDTVPEPPAWRIFFERVKSERKPFVVRLEGIVNSTVRLSAVRAAILITLLLDLEDRAANGKGVLDPTNAIIDAYTRLAPQEIEDPAKVPNRIRVALYRFAEFLEEELGLKRGKSFVEFEPETLRFHSAARTAKLPTVEVATTDTAISGIIDSLLATSPLARVRRQKALFMPSGHEGYDRFLLELFDHSYPVTMTTMFIRPSVNTFPEKLLKKIGSSQHKLKRRALALEGFKNDRCRHREFLQRGSLWDLIRHSPGKVPISYPATVTKEDVIEHLEFIIQCLNRYPQYELLLTDALFPYNIVSFGIESGRLPEYFTLLLQHVTRETLFDVSAFVICDCNVHQGASSKLFDWIIKHPATSSSRGAVIKEVKAVKNYLELNGWLKENEERPGQ